MSHAQERTEILVGQQGLRYLAEQHFMIVGIGGVGGAVAEAMARAGVGGLTLIDHDTVGLSNMNRQLVCTQQTVGMSKVDAMGQRLLSINPDLELDCRAEFLNQENIEVLLQEKPVDYVLDCIDSVACKATLVATCQRLGLPVASSLGAGGRLDVRKVEMTTLDKTFNCGLAANLRRRLRKQGASLSYPVVFSSEYPIKPLPHQAIEGAPEAMPRAVNGTISYMPNIFGFMLAGFVLQYLLGKR